MSGVYAKKILIIENDQNISSGIVSALAPYGYECFLSHEPSVIVSGLAQLRPDLILLDVAMQGVDGFAIFEAIRALPDPAIASTPVLVGSSDGDLGEIARAIKLNIKDYFIKANMDPRQVADKVRKILGDNIPAIAPLPSALPELALESKILIVEDDKFLRDLAVQKLTKEHLQVFAAMDGEQGVLLAEQQEPEMILLDILLPGIDGFEVLARLRANPKLAETHIAMLSNFGQREDIERAFGLGADHFFVKANYTLDEIVQEVKKIMSTPRTVSAQKNSPA
jgi:DNA-binding response OmpR family regulator